MSITTRYHAHSAASMVPAKGTPVGPETNEPEAPHVVRFDIEGLTCAAEAIRLEHRLTGSHGVLRVTVNPINEIAYVGFDPTQVTPDEIKGRIEAAGFGATGLLGHEPNGRPNGNTLRSHPAG